MTSKCPICGSDLETGYNCNKCGYPQNEARETALCHAYYKTGYEQAKYDMRNRIRDAISEIQHMSGDFDISQVDEWNSKSLACVIGRCSKWAVNIIRKHTGVKE